MVGPIGSEPDSILLYADKPVHATNLRLRADVLDKTGITSIAEEYRRRANEDTARRHYNLFTKEELELWFAYLTSEVRSEFASEMTDGAVMRLKEAVRHDCFDGFLVRQRFATGEVMIIGYVETYQEVLYFPVTFWAPTAAAPVTAEELRTTLQEKRDREARRKAAQEKREAEQAKAAEVERGEAARMSRLAWIVSAVVFAVINLVFFWVLGRGWGALALLVTLISIGWHYYLNSHELGSRRAVRRYIVKPLAVLCLIWTIGAGAAFAQFSVTSQVITICGPGQDLNVQTYKALDGTVYEMTSDAEDQFYRDDSLNEWGYGRVTAEVERRLLFGYPAITSLKHTPDNNSEEVQALCKAPTV